MFKWISKKEMARRHTDHTDINDALHHLIEAHSMPDTREQVEETLNNAMRIGLAVIHKIAANTEEGNVVEFDMEHFNLLGVQQVKPTDFN